MKNFVSCFALVACLFLFSDNANAHNGVVRNVTSTVVQRTLNVADVGVGVLQRGRTIVRNVVVNRQPVRSLVRRVLCR